MNRKAHWNHIYSTTKPGEVSWHQESPTVALSIIRSIGSPPEAGIVDVGGGASALAVHLVRAGHYPVAVLDISAAAIGQAKKLAGKEAEAIDWIEASITEFTATRTYGIWHDRAVFHFLTDASDRRKYVTAMRRTLPIGGHAIIAAFAPDGPEQCSGLPIRRYDAPMMAEEIGQDFELVETISETHLTPWETEQKFNHFHLKKRTEEPS